MRKLVAAALTCAVFSGVPSVVPVLAAGPTTRTLYVTVVDERGRAVPGLKAADFSVVEGGKPRTITSAAPASEKIRLALMVEQILVSQSYVRLGIAQFAERMSASAEIALFTVSQRAEKMVDYTSDPNLLVDAISNLPVGLSRQSGAVPDAIYEVAKQFEKAKPARPVIVMAVIEQGQSTDTPEGVLTQIARSKAQVWAVSLSVSGTAANSFATRQQTVGREQVIGDGSMQSGGRRIPLSALSGFQAGLHQVADDLQSQYLITYILPDGVKPSDRVSVSLEKPGATLRAPKRVPK